MVVSKLRSAITLYSEGGLRRVTSGISTAARREFNSIFRAGVPIYEFDWDLLVVLDGCRADLLHSVVPQHSYLNTDTTYSVGTKTTEWMAKNFSETYRDEMSSTAYISANPNSNKFVSGAEFAILDEPWRYAWDDEIGTVHPRTVTDRAIDIHRDQSPEKMIVHYMQPHEPFLTKDQHGSCVRKYPPSEGSIWDRLDDGEVKRQDVWDAYRETLLIVLEYVDVLLENVAADEVLITSDHGNAMGEFGYYGHPRWTPIKSLKEVPAVRTTAYDSGEYEPSTEHEEDGDSQDIEKRLQDLGYL